MLSPPDTVGGTTVDTPFGEHRNIISIKSPMYHYHISYLHIFISSHIFISIHFPPPPPTPPLLPLPIVLFLFPTLSRLSIMYYPSPNKHLHPPKSYLNPSSPITHSITRSITYCHHGHNHRHHLIPARLSHQVMSSSATDACTTIPLSQWNIANCTEFSSEAVNI